MKKTDSYNKYVPLFIDNYAEQRSAKLRARMGWAGYGIYLAILQRLRSGRIVCITSVSGLIGNRGQVNYSASKAGIIGAAKALAVELAKRKITVNCVAPGLIDTDILDENLPIDEILKMIPVARMGSPEEVAHAVDFLMDEKAAYITRQVIAVNGGLC